MKSNTDQSSVTDVNVESIVDGESVFNVVYSEPFMEFSLNDNEIQPKPFQTETWSNLRNLNEKSIIDKIILSNKFGPPEFMMNKMEELKRDVIKAKSK